MKRLIKFRLWKKWIKWCLSELSNKILRKKYFLKSRNFQVVSFASNVNSPIFSTLQTLVNQNENPSNIDLLRKILNQIQNMEKAQKEQEKRIVMLIENIDKRLLKLEQKFDKLIGGMQKTLNEIQEWGYAIYMDYLININFLWSLLFLIFI